MKLARRDFLVAGAAAALLSKLLWAAEQKLPLAFSTLGCPGWEWKKILEFAQANGFAAIELRGLMGKMDLPALPEFSPAPNLRNKTASGRARAENFRFGQLLGDARGRPG